MYCRFDNTDFDDFQYDLQIVMQRKNGNVDFNQTNSTLTNFYGDKQLDEWWMGLEYLRQKCNYSYDCTVVFLLKPNKQYEPGVDKHYILAKEFRIRYYYKFYVSNCCTTLDTKLQACNIIDELYGNQFYAQDYLDSNNCVKDLQSPGFFYECTKANLFGKYPPQIDGESVQKYLYFQYENSSENYWLMDNFLMGIRKYNSNSIYCNGQSDNCLIQWNNNECKICKEGYYKNSQNVCVYIKNKLSSYCLKWGYQTCLSCSYGRVPPFCFCQQGQYQQCTYCSCRDCPSDTYFDNDEYNIMVDNIQFYNSYEYKQAVCKPCSSKHGSECLECTQDECTKCKDGRILPFCYCQVGYYPDQNNDCEICPNYTGFSENNFTSMIQNNVQYTSQEYYNNMCINCTEIHNESCLECTYDECTTCKEGRILPYCYCQFGYYLDSNFECVECPSQKAFSETYFQEMIEQKKQIDLNNYDNMCIDCTDIHNESCEECTQQECTKCRDGMVLPHCYCQFGFYYDGNNCVECPYYTGFLEKNYKIMIENQIKYNDQNYYSNVCKNCNNLHNSYCLECTENECTKCSNGRILPYCYCQVGYYPYNTYYNNYCRNCPSSTGFSETNFNYMVRYQLQYSDSEYYDKMCISCQTLHNSNCKSCTEKQCTQCDGEMILPYCYCQLGFYQNNTQCIECPSHKAFSETNFTIMVQYQKEYSDSDYYNKMCIDCTDLHNESCEECTEQECTKCKDGMVLPHCYCQFGFYYDGNNCVECPSSTGFLETNYKNMIENQLQYNDQNYDYYVCKDCKILHNNLYCLECTENECTLCSDDRILPLCYCQVGFYPLNEQCQACPQNTAISITNYNNMIEQNQNYQNSDEFSQMCIPCTDIHNKMCTECTEKQCSKCQDDRIPSNCQCPEEFYSQGDICQKCDEDQAFMYEQYYYMLKNNINYNNTYHNQKLCKSCSQQHNQYCEKCSQEKCTQCQGDLQPPFCYCQQGYYYQSSKCETCPQNTYFSIKNYIYMVRNSKYYNDNNEYKEKVCIECNVEFNQFCLECDAIECTKCKGDLQPPFCNCEFNYMLEKDSSDQCKQCNSDQYADQSLLLQKCPHTEYSPECSETFICKNCSDKFGQFCLECEETQCTKCEGNNRIPPFCDCEKKLTPDPELPSNCINCPQDTFYIQSYDNRCTQEQKANQSTNCEQKDICQEQKLDFIFYCDIQNQYYNDIISEYICLQCQGNRLELYCQCPNEMVPILGNETYCQDCPLGTFYKLQNDTCKYPGEDPYIYNCKQEDICVSCKQYHNKFCESCSETQCLQCSGNRVLPHCQCQNETVTKRDDQENCYTCYYDTYYDAPADECNIGYTNDIKYDCFYEDICIECSNYNKFCILCDSSECLQCEGNRVAPHCKCPLDWVTQQSQNSNQYSTCVECSSGFYYDIFKDTCRLDKESLYKDQQSLQNYYEDILCSVDQICQSCSNINQFCTVCDLDYLNNQLKCQQCLGDLLVTDQGKIQYEGNTLQFITCQCPENKYSYDINSEKCNECPKNTQCTGTDKIFLGEGYWRLNNYTVDIYSCDNNPEACLGGPDNFTCAEGYVGALCESCDYLGETWGTPYGKQDEYKCAKCDKKNIYLKLFGYMAFMSALTTYMSYKGVEEVQNQLQMEALQNMFPKSNLNSKAQFTTYIKIFMQYFNSISLLAQIDIVDFSFISIFTENAGNPSTVIGYNADCFLSDVGSGIPMPQFRIFFLFVQFIFYIFVCMSFFIIFKRVLFKTKQMIIYYPNEKEKHLYMPSECYDPSPKLSILLVKILIFLFLDVQPSFVNVIIDSISCKKVGDIDYLKSDTTIQCSSTQFYLWVGCFSYTNGLFWGIILPLILALTLKKYKSKKKFDSKNVQIQQYEQNLEEQEKRYFQQFKQKIRNNFKNTQNIMQQKNIEMLQKINLNQSSFTYSNNQSNANLISNSDLTNQNISPTIRYKSQDKNKVKLIKLQNQQKQAQTNIIIHQNDNKNNKEIMQQTGQNFKINQESNISSSICIENSNPNNSVILNGSLISYKSDKKQEQEEEYNVSVINSD
ncbi:Insulin-like growth factor binding protein, N-terminal [Pseudocohnilembus persalinus]|uniref:Insulin-like growth factor binding protein, N-terminal n=1 Tax=Pseudocohnilembus persalinus TaxID=266149 RepID=A0A0V0R3R3_PSEPJ|nr:Insulin-like growth factor binding protein, N-terminal [Pseudocohnilembus persalinus]|eukprot:KRX09034.1 Insulin-like growth factor binding protein, N-terminal [Pseudocohnilembus persalinus]